MPASLEHLLVDVADIYRQSPTSSGHGRFLRGLALLFSDVKFRSYAAGGKELVLGAQLKANVSHVGFVLPTVDVAKDDVIEVTVKEGGTPLISEQYRVIVVLRPSLVHHQKLLLEFIAQGAL